MSDDEKRLLKELTECQNSVNDDEYTPEDRLILLQLKEKRFVDLRWVTTPFGKAAL